MEEEDEEEGEAADSDEEAAGEGASAAPAPASEQPTQMRRKPASSEKVTAAVTMQDVEKALEEPLGNEL